MKFLFILFILLSSCHKKDKLPQPVSVPRLQELIDKKTTYCRLALKNAKALQYNIHGCDSLLHASLLGVACGKVPIEKFEVSPGKWNRKTTHDCYPQGSKSTISNDMLLGLIHYLWSTKDVVNVQELIAYGETHGWVMGDADPKDRDGQSRILLSPNLIAKLYDIEKRLTDSSRADAKHVEYPVAYINKGFASHLDVVNILLTARIYGGISSQARQILEGQAKRQPDNALYQFAYHLFKSDYDVTSSVELLLNEKHFPTNSLPTSSNHCTNYLFMHDKKESSWAPCLEGKTHPGVDLVFAISVIDGTLFK